MVRVYFKKINHSDWPKYCQYYDVIKRYGEKSGTVKVRDTSDTEFSINPDFNENSVGKNFFSATVLGFSFINTDIRIFSVFFNEKYGINTSLRLKLVPILSNTDKIYGKDTVLFSPYASVSLRNTDKIRVKKSPYSTLFRAVGRPW